MLLNNVTKSHKILIKTIRLKGWTSLVRRTYGRSMTTFGKQTHSVNPDQTAPESSLIWVHSLLQRLLPDDTQLNIQLHVQVQSVTKKIDFNVFLFL